MFCECLVIRMTEICRRASASMQRRQKTEENPFIPLIEFLESEFQHEMKVYNDMINAGIISFEALNTYFAKGLKNDMKRVNLSYRHESCRSCAWISRWW